MSIARPDWGWEPIQSRGLNPAYTSVDEPVVQVARASCEQVLGQEPRLGFSSGYLDMDFMVNDLGIPSVNIGPGDVSLAHGGEEQVSVQELRSASRIYTRAALQLGQLPDREQSS